jgi:hypothetical protein
VFVQAQSIEQLWWQAVFPSSNAVLTRRCLKEGCFPVFAQRESGLELHMNIWIWRSEKRGKDSVKFEVLTVTSL